VKLLAVKFELDHTHLFIGGGWKCSVSKLARYSKGASSRELRKKPLGLGSKEGVGQGAVERRLLL